VLSPLLLLLFMLLLLMSGTSILSVEYIRLTTIHAVTEKDVANPLKKLDDEVQKVFLHILQYSTVLTKTRAIILQKSPCHCGICLSWWPTCFGAVGLGMAFSCSTSKCLHIQERKFASKEWREKCQKARFTKLFLYKFTHLSSYQNPSVCTLQRFYTSFYTCHAKKSYCSLCLPRYTLADGITRQWWQSNISALDCGATKLPSHQIW